MNERELMMQPLGANKDEIAFDLFGAEAGFASALRSGYRTSFAVKNTETLDIMERHPMPGRYGTQGGYGLSPSGAKLYDSIASAVTVGRKNGQFGVHGEGNHFVHGELIVDEFAHLLGPLTVEEATELMSTLLVKGAARFESPVEFKSTTTFQGNEDHNGVADYAEGSIRIPALNLEIDGQPVDGHTQELVVSTIRGRVASPDGAVILYVETPAAKKVTDAESTTQGPAHEIQHRLQDVKPNSKG